MIGWKRTLDIYHGKQKEHDVFLKVFFCKFSAKNISGNISYKLL
jgi:hypothetical protein